jgi:hypothetical protein
LGGNHAYLFQQPKLIPAIPGFHEQSVALSQDYDSGNRDSSSRGRNSKAQASMCTCQRQAHYGFMFLDNDVVNADVNIGQRRTQVSPKNLEIRGTVNVLASFTQTVRHNIPGTKFIDNFLPALIPYFFKPSMSQLRTIECHLFPPETSLSLSRFGQGCRALNTALATDESTFGRTITYKVYEYRETLLPKDAAYRGRIVRGRCGHPDRLAGWGDRPGADSVASLEI